MTAALAVWSFVKANFRWLVPLLAVLSLCWYISHLQSQRDAAVSELKQWQHAVKVAADARRADNKRKEDAAKLSAAKNSARHAGEIAILRRKYADEKDANNRNSSNWRERLRLDVAATAARLRENQGAAEGLAESGRECDTAAARRNVENLKAACAITTSDFNACRTWIDDTCSIYGCSQE